MKNIDFSKSYIFLGLGFFSLFILFYTHNSWVEFTNNNKLHIDNISRVQINVTNAHLWFEESISGDTSIELNTDFWDKLTAAEVLLNQLSEGGTNGQGTSIVPVLKTSTRDEIKNALSSLILFKEVAQQRLDGIASGGVGSELDQQFDGIYEKLISSARNINDELNESLILDIERQNYQYYVISIIWLLIISFFVYRFEQSRKLQSTLESLLIDEKNNLESRVKERTLELSIAKEQAETAKLALDQHSLVSIADIEGNILYVNDKFVEISGYQESELIGKKHSVLNSNNQPKSYWQNMHQTVLAGKVWHDEVRNRAKSGDYYWVDTTIVPNFDSNKEVKGFTSIRTDITQQKLNIDNLALAKEQAEAATEAKTQFLATMSHEIRTPMNGVIGMTNLLLDTSLNKEQYNFAKTVKYSAESLLTVINDILDFSKVEAGLLELEPIEFDLELLLHDVGSSIAFQAQNKGLELICPANIMPSQSFIADSGRIRQILNNLIGNAIKFTDEGEVSVYCNVQEQTASHTKLLFEITDTGIGLSDEQQSKLFERFSQADSSTTRKYGGTGLGLSISKQLVEMMDGEIGIKSVEGKGSTFWFTLNIANTNTVRPKKAFDNLQEQKILVVDDNLTNRVLLGQLLTKWQVGHTLVDSGKRALEKLTEESSKGTPYHIAILDMQMPQMDGFQLGTKIKNDNLLFKDTRLVMLTSQGQRGDVDKLQAAGFNGYLNKPIDQTILYNTLMTVAGISCLEQPLITAHSSREIPQFTARVLVVEDNAINQKVAQGLLKKFGVQVDLAANGEEALYSLENLPFDLVLMDCQMPVMDGYEATQQIRHSQSKVRNRDIPIIAMTANSMEGDREKCLAVGMNDFISKPINPNKVQEILKCWLPK